LAIKQFPRQVLFSSATGEWATPTLLFQDLDQEFRFELDAAASEANAKCPRFYTKKRDGLARPWAPLRTFVNPPYGRAVGCWVLKAYTEWKRGALVVMLLPVRTCTGWFHQFIYHQAEIRFLKGRLKFGGAKNGAPFPSMIVIFRPGQHPQ